MDVHELRAGDVVIATDHRRYHLDTGTAHVVRVTDLGGDERQGVGVVAYPDGQALELMAYCSTPYTMPPGMF